ADGQAVLGLRVVDAVAARQVAAGLLADLRAAAQHLPRQLEGDLVPGPGQQVDRQHRLAAHRVDVGERVGGRDPAPVVGVVDDRGEEFGGGDQRAATVQPHGRAVVAVLVPDDEVSLDTGGPAEASG